MAVVSSPSREALVQVGARRQSLQLLALLPVQTVQVE